MLTKKQKFVYGFARFGSTIFMALYDFASFYIYWHVFKLDPALAGIMGAAGKITIMIASYIVGFISDSIWTRLGRRKPFILTGAPMLALWLLTLHTNLFSNKSRPVFLVFVGCGDKCPFPHLLCMASNSVSGLASRDFRAS